MSCLKAPASGSERSPLLRVSHISCKRDIRSRCQERASKMVELRLWEPSPPHLACAVSPQQMPSTQETLFSLPDNKPRIYSVPRENNLHGGHRRPRQQSPRGPEKKPHGSQRPAGLLTMLMAHLIPVLSFSFLLSFFYFFFP